MKTLLRSLLVAVCVVGINSRVVLAHDHPHYHSYPYFGYGYHSYYAPYYWPRYYSPPMYYYSAPAPVYVPTSPVVVAPGNTIVYEYSNCRLFSGDATVDYSGRPYYGRACLGNDGLWHIVP